MRQTICIVLLSATVIVSCNSSTDFHGDRVSDATISFNAGGKHYVISDSIYPGDPSYTTMSGSYFFVDSMLSLNGTGMFGGTDFSGIHFEIKTKADTGSDLLGVSESPPNPFSGNAWVTLPIGSIPARAWGTDTIHKGIVHLTEFDTLLHHISGTFRFTAIKTDPTTLMSDTILIENGVINHVRVDMVRP